MVQPAGLTILGATGSIGLSTLDVVARNRDRFELIALTAYSDHEALFELCREHQPRCAVLVKEDAAGKLASAIRKEGLSTEVLVGEQALADVASHPDTKVVMAAIVGAAGLKPTLAAAHAGKRILLANKEALVMSGTFFMQAIQKSGGEIVPIDSEHNAIFQCLGGQRATRGRGIRRIVLTASGGPLLTLPAGEFASVTPEQACNHPNWDMGAKISVDSATLMNKGLEVIEACWLFDVKPEMIEVVVHPQSVVHSMVEYEDGTVMAELGHPDMRTPIAYGLGYPDRIDSGLPSLDFCRTPDLTFQPVDEKKFPCLGLAIDAAQAGGRMPTVLNAANEIAVARFLSGELPFDEIPHVIAKTLGCFEPGSDASVEEVLATDRRAREVAADCISHRAVNLA